MSTTHTIRRLDDETAHRQAIDHAVRALELDREPTVTWDPEHHLQGHLDVRGRHLVLIAARTAAYVPHLFSETEWATLRHGPAA